jgi:hypothetical protein
VLIAEGNRTKTIERMVQVAAGEPTVVELELEMLPGGTISGFVRSQSGHYEAVNLVALGAPGRQSDRFLAEVQWANDGGALVGRFAFEDVPNGEYELSPAGDSQFEWRTSSVTVSPPSSDLELLFWTGREASDSRSRRLNSRTGRPLRELNVLMGRKRQEKPVFTRRVDGSHRLQLGRFPRDVALEWEVRCDGYVPVAGDLSSFQQVARKRTEPLFRDRLELQPGWGGRVLAYTKTERIRRSRSPV